MWKSFDSSRVEGKCDQCGLVEDSFFCPFINRGNANNLSYDLTWYFFNFAIEIMCTTLQFGSSAKQRIEDVHYFMGKNHEPSVQALLAAVRRLLDFHGSFCDHDQITALISAKIVAFNIVESVQIVPCVLLN